MNLLEVQDLRVTLQTSRGPAQALRGSSFAMARGDTVGLIGESGCGKSLTALALMGLLPEGAKVSGSIRLAGQELTTLDEAALCALRNHRHARRNAPQGRVGAKRRQQWLRRHRPADGPLHIFGREKQKRVTPEEGQVVHSVNAADGLCFPGQRCLQTLRAVLRGFRRGRVYDHDDVLMKIGKGLIEGELVLSPCKLARKQVVRFGVEGEMPCGVGAAGG